MPTIARLGPYRFFFYSNEWREPAHVHVQRDRATAKFWLTPLALARSTGFAAHELAKLKEMVGGRQQELMEAWNECFGSAS
jgi:hypothetical protein